MVVQSLYLLWTTHLDFCDSRKCITLLFKLLLFWIFSHPQLNILSYWTLPSRELTFTLQFSGLDGWSQKPETGFACAPGLVPFGVPSAPLRIISYTDFTWEHSDGLKPLPRLFCTEITKWKTGSSQAGNIRESTGLAWGVAGSAAHWRRYSHLQQSAAPQALLLEAKLHLRPLDDKSYSFQESLEIWIFIWNCSIFKF